NIGGIPEQVRDGVEGRLFEAGNPDSLASVMDEFATQKEAAVEMGLHARQRLLNKYSLTTHEQRLLDLYQQLVSEAA
ncbi:glycosyltransferase family 1 protein, partial [Vibrio fluvialis]|nr:glycosyltransferase family 1 protein [Vibrio fluvialis]